MSLTNGTNGTTPDTLERYREVRRRNRLLQEEIRSVALEKLHQRTCKPGDSEVTALRKRLQESAGWEWVGAYDEAFDRLTGPDRDMLQPVSLYQDRRYGANWPFWRTWLEHARIRAGGRLICTQGTLAPGALKGLTNYVVGEGFTDRAVAKREETPKELVDCVQEALDEFRQHNQWNLQQRELFVMSRRDGEYFLRFVPDDGGMLEIDQILPEQIMEPNNNDPPTTSFGCINELGRLEKITGYNLCLDGDQSQGFIAPAEEIIHTKINVDRMVKRGLSDFSFDTYDTLKGAQRLLDNLSAGTSIQASIALIRQHEQSVQAEVQGFVSANSDFVEPGPLGNYPSGTNGYSGGVARYAPGRIEDIPKGYNYVAPPFATNAQNFIAVEQAVLRSVAVRWNAPEWLISGDASSNNYASSITAESPFVKSCKGEQAFYHYGFHRTAREAVKVRCEAGRLRCMGRSWTWDEVDRMVEVKTEPPTIEVRNKLQEAQRNQVAIQAGAFSPQMWCQEENVDYEQVVKDLEEHKQVAGDQGPELPGMGGGGDEGGGGGGGGGLQPPEQEPPPAQPGSGLAQALGESLWESLVEAHLLEAGFTGETNGRWYRDGKRIPNPNKPVPVKKERAPKAPPPGAPSPRAGASPPEKAKPTVDEAHQAIAARLKTGQPFSKEEAGALVAHILGLTGAQINELKTKLGLKASGTKAEMAEKLVIGGFTKLAAEAAAVAKKAAALKLKADKVAAAAKAKAEKAVAAEKKAAEKKAAAAAKAAAVAKKKAAAAEKKAATLKAKKEAAEKKAKKTPPAPEPAPGTPPAPEPAPKPPEPAPAPAETGATPASPEPGFTGTDTLGRKWVNGKLVPGEEEPPVNKAHKGFDPAATRRVRGAGLVPGLDNPVAPELMTALKDGLTSKGQYSAPGGGLQPWHYNVGSSIAPSSGTPAQHKALLKAGLIEVEPGVGGMLRLTAQGAARLRLERIGKTAADLETMPHPVTKSAIDLWTAVYPSMSEGVRKRLGDHYGLDIPSQQDSGQDANDYARGLADRAKAAFSRIASDSINPDIAQQLRGAKDIQALVANISRLPDLMPLRKKFDDLWKSKRSLDDDVQDHLIDGANSGKSAKWKKDHEVLTKKLNDTTNKWLAAAREFNDAKAKSDAAVKKMLALPPDQASDVKFRPPNPADPQQPADYVMKAVGEGAGWLTGVVGKGPAGEHLKEFGTKLVDARAHYNDKEHSINTGSGMDSGTAVHEMCHGVEITMPGALAASRAFLAYRTHGEKPTKMNDVYLRSHPGTPPPGPYSDSEVGRKDKFDLAMNEGSAYYVGKHYADATEILSMGAEQLHRDPAGFARRDPEYAAFVIGLLHGGLRRKEIPQ